MGLSSCHDRHHSLVLDRSVEEVWDVVRDFDSYPVWVNGVEDSYIEEGLSGTSVGGVRNFAIGETRQRQRLVAHSDTERFFTYEGCDTLRLELQGSTRTLHHYRGTLRVREIIEGDRTFAEWSARYECDPEDTEVWDEWWSGALPTWLKSLREYFDHLPISPGPRQDIPPERTDLHPG